MIYLSLNTASEFVCFVLALIFLIRDKDPVWRMMIIFMMLTCLVEMTGIHMRRVWHVPNYKLYNIFILVECAFVSLFFYNLYTGYQAKFKWLIGWLILFITLYVTELISNHNQRFVSVTAAIMSVAFVLACLSFYYHKLKDEKFEPLLTSASFWWVSGVLFFYFGGTAINVFFDYLQLNEVINFDASIRHTTFAVLNVVLYSLWSISFICRYCQRKLLPFLGLLPLFF